MRCERGPGVARGRTAPDITRCPHGVPMPSGCPDGRGRGGVTAKPRWGWSVRRFATRNPYPRTEDPDAHINPGGRHSHRHCTRYGDRCRLTAGRISPGTDCRCPDMGRRGGSGSGATSASPDTCAYLTGALQAGRRIGLTTALPMGRHYRRHRHRPQLLGTACRRWGHAIRLRLGRNPVTLDAPMPGMLDAPGIWRCNQ